MKRNVKKCVICGKEYFCSPSKRVSTCSKECHLKYMSRIHKGSKRTAEARQKMAKARKNLENATEIQRNATEAAKKSPKSGRFITNRSAIDWHIVSPDGEHFCFHSLAFWLRENGERYFNTKPDTKEFYNVVSGFSRAKRAALGKIPAEQRPVCTYKGWRVIPTDDDRSKLYKDISKQV